MNTQTTNTAYSTVANEILSNLPDEDKSYTAEIEIGNLMYFVDIEYTVKYRDVIGGSYENREFEIISELVGEDNTSTLRYFDVDAQAFRSFRIENLITVY